MKEIPPTIAHEKLTEGMFPYTAAQRYRNQEKWQEYIELKEIYSEQNTNFWSNQSDKTLPQLMESVVDHFKQREGKTHPNEIKYEALLPLYHMLSETELLAYGYDRSRNAIANAPPARLPLDLIECIKWDSFNDRAKGNGLDFRSVRIFTRDQVCSEGALLLEQGQAKPKLPSGRPSKEELIVSAYKDLRESRQIDYSLPMILSAKKIRDYVLKVFQPEDDKGLQVETIRRKISPLFQINKESVSNKRDITAKTPD